jgi:signal transduction histidine kinase
MVTDLLDVSRVQTGQLGLHRNSCDIVGVTRLCVEELRVTWDTRTITLEAEDEEVFVHADADRIRQVVANFVTNALKYSAPDRPVVVAVRRERDTVRVQVRDQGPGLTDEQQRTIWERYRRVQAVPVLDDSQGIGGGLGLGLYVSRTIIQDHGGAVGVESTPGVGSTFWFTLGLAEPDGELHPSCR